jgi:hypothetical protein
MRPVPIDEKTRQLAADVVQAVSFVADDHEIHALVTRLEQALANDDRPTLLKLARAIGDHAENRYEAVVGAADRLVKHLGG